MGPDGGSAVAAASAAVAAGGGVVALDMRAFLRRLGAAPPATDMYLYHVPPAAPAPARAPHTAAEPFQGRGDDLPLETAFVRALFSSPAASATVCDLLRRHGPTLAARRFMPADADQEGDLAEANDE